ncbi:hypothetical protein [Streptomyces sp. NPDC005209]
MTGPFHLRAVPVTACGCRVPVTAGLTVCASIVAASAARHCA